MTIGNEWAGVASHLHGLLPGLRDRGIGVSCVLFSEALLAERLRDSGVDVLVLERRWRYDPRTVGQVRAYLKRWAIDVVHMHGYMAVAYGCAASALLPVGRVVTFHQPGQPSAEIEDWSFRYSLLVAYRLAGWLNARFIGVSEDIRDSYVAKYGLSVDRIRVIRNGVAIPERPTVEFQQQFRRELNVSDGDTIVTIVGRLIEIKGHRYFLEAGKDILANNPHVVFLIIGDGPLGAELQELSANLGLGQRVRFLGFRRDVEAFLGITDILVIASLFEGLPYTLLQAMASGISVVATHCGGLAEVLEDRVDALMVPPRSAADIAKAILELSGDPDLSRTLGENARSKIVNSLSLDATIEQTRDLYLNMR